MAKPAKVLLNVPKIKADFPILQRTIRDKRLVYLDSAATSQKPRQVIDATSDYYSRYNANVHRAIYELGEESTREYEGAREKLAAFIGAKSPNEVVFTKSTTESINVIAYGYGLKGKITKGDEIVGSVMEHHSNHVPWHFVKDHKGVVLKYVDVNDDGTLKMEQYDDLLSNRTKIVTVTLCSNVLGTINPVKEIVKKAHEVGAICVVDAAQAAPHMPIDVGDLDADFLAFSGHKMLGPTGIGIGAAVDYLSNIGMEAVRAHEMEITEYALEKLGRLKGVRTFGPKDVTKRAGVVSFTIDNAHPHDIASILDVEGICVRSGHHCAQPLMERFGLPATARASFYIYNDLEDVDALVAGIKRVQEVFA